MLRKYKTPEEAKEAKRDRDKARKHRGKSGKKHTKKSHGFFVAWDGEGRDTYEVVGYGDDSEQHLVGFVGESEAVYGRKSTKLSMETLYKHEMNVFAYSNESGSISGLRNENRRLTTDELLAFIGEGVKASGPLAIHVSFSFTYDVTHILYDMEREQVQHALNERRQKLSDYGRYGSYLIKYRPRKQLYIGKLRDTDQPYVATIDGNGVKKWKIDLDWSVTIYDTFGFFQCGFLKALEIWGVGSEDELSTIRVGKEGRALFAEWNTDAIVAYNNLELSLLCRLMYGVRKSLQAIDLHLTRWDGAGAVATALYQKELSKDYIRSITLPEEVEKAAYHAYAGGRSECVQQGMFLGNIYRYDINSAYPDAMRTIPDLTNGTWEKCWDYENIANFALYHIRWAWKDKSEPFLPFFYRSSLGSIYFPPLGENWIWGCELKVAKEHCASLAIEILDCWHFIAHSDVKPFQFIETYYKTRLTIKERLKNGLGTEEDKGASLVIKLGLNSLYGKTIQKVGVSRDEQGTLVYPPFYNIVIGSYITAFTRAKLYVAACGNKRGIILFATDGILSTERLTCVTSSSIGDYEAELLDGIVMLQGGIYWLLKGGAWSEKSRGIDRASDAGEEHRQAVLTGWKQHDETVSFPLRRFLGVKYSSLTTERWKYRGCWTVEEKKIKLHDAGEKREQTPRSVRLDKCLYTTGINWPDMQLTGDRLPMSEPRPLPQPDDNEEEREE